VVATVQRASREKRLGQLTEAKHELGLLVGANPDGSAGGGKYHPARAHACTLLARMHPARTHARTHE
jgi:hypothetical protein